MSQYPVLHTASKSIEEHLSLIQRQVKRSVRDPELRQLAVKLVSGSYVWKQDPRTGQEAPFVKAWSYYFQAPAREGCPTRDDECEVLRIWDFTVLNFRYVYDPDEVDTFATAKLSLEAGGGDCFPVGTLVWREGKTSVVPGPAMPIEEVRVGDTVYDGERYVKVLKTWNRGPRDMIQATLDSGKQLFLSDRHKVLRIVEGEEHECRMSQLVVGDVLLQRPGTPGARVTHLSSEEPVHCVDIMTESGRVYLPQSDVIVRQCDDATILICSLLKTIGFSTAARVISVQEDPENWVHVYPLVGLPKDNPQEWIPLDITVTGYKPGDQYHDIGKLKDFPM